MRVTASHIVNWVNTHTKEAQVHLPLLVRRLCFQKDATRHFSFPAGDSTYMPGWDGLLVTEGENAWIPAGTSFWEVGCDLDISKKATGDYLKRTSQTSFETRLTSTFVFVSPRRWTKKSEWIATQIEKGEWSDVRAYDADDLEQWLENTPAVALQFAEELGLSGEGVESPLRHWAVWSQQSSPSITADALFMDRAEIRDTLSTKALESLSRLDVLRPLTVRADSVQEATAFIVATILGSGNLADHTLVVTEVTGWRFVEANPQLKIAIAASTDVAASPVSRQGLLVIVPHATGDLQGRGQSEGLIIERPNIYEFERALIAIGMDESDAKRFALSTGRSWTVFRRQRAREALNN